MYYLYGFCNEHINLYNNLYLYLQKLNLDKLFRNNHFFTHRLTEKLVNAPFSPHYVYMYIIMKDFYFKLIERTWAFFLKDILFFMYRCINYINYMQYKKVYYVYIYSQYAYQYTKFYKATE